MLYGPNVDINGHPTGGQGLIAGDETLAYAAENGAGTPITLMVQVPDSYNPDQGCIVTGRSSGSRGIYGAIASAGDWGLKHGCAVAYTDKGTGTGFDDLQNGLVDTLRGDVTTIAAAGANAQFVAPLSPEERAQYNAAFPNRFAFKHAFSRQNPERDWGTDVLEFDPVRLLRAQPKVSRRQYQQAEHGRHRLQRVQRRRSVAARD